MVTFTWTEKKIILRLKKKDQIRIQQIQRRDVQYFQEGMSQAEREL